MSYIIAIPEKLNALARLFQDSSPLYLVGGFVRDSILGLNPYDIDICSPLTVDEVKTLLENSAFQVLPVNLRVGTIIIKNGDFKAEYTCFRCDSYPEGSGIHIPENVVFTRDISLDALRRDFKANAVYYDIANKKIVDILGGIADIENKVLSCADKPKIVFSADGLRILRLVRQASEFGFSIEEDTLSVATEMVDRLRDIASERIQTELNRILIADTAHPELKTVNAHIKGVQLLDKLGALDIIFPELTAMRGLPQKPQYHLYDAYEHSLKAFELSPPQIRLAALLHDIGKLPTQKKQGNMHGHDIVGAEMVKTRLNALKYPRETIERTAKLVSLHMYDLRGETSIGKVRLFIQKNCDVIEDLFLLQRADCYASLGEKAVYTERLEGVYAEMKRDETPFSVKDLKVDGKDLIELNIDEKSRNTIMQELLQLAILDENVRSREKQLNFLHRRKNK